MKKFLFLSALAAVTGLMTSCSQDDDFTGSTNANGESSTAVSFTTNTQNAVTTRSGATINSLDKFYVTGVNPEKTSFFNQEEFKYDYATAQFRSAINHYWPVNSNLSFYAISNEGTVTFDGNAVPSYTYTDWGGETDLVAATVVSGEKQIPYPLTFKHLTSKVAISAEAEDKAQTLAYKLVGVKMKTPSTGTYSFATATGGQGSWSIDNSKTSTYAYTASVPQTFGQTSSVNSGSENWNILPVTTGNIEFTVEYTVSQNGKVIADFTGSNAKTCVVEQPNLQMGKKYNYNFILSVGTYDVITFTATVTDWATGSDDDVYSETYNGHDYVDLGLPSGIKWATKNVGATSVTDCGSYFAWGELAPKSDYEYLNYRWYNSSTGLYTKYTWTGSSSDGKTVLDLADDAVRENMGGRWRTPTCAQFQELIDNTICTWTSSYQGSGRAGYIFTNKKDTSKSIFLPAAGFDGGSDLNEYGWYWTASGYVSSNDDSACQLFFYNGYLSCNDQYTDRYSGLTLRGICME